MKHLLLKTWLMLCLLLVGVGTTWATDVTFSLGTTSGKDISSSSGTTKSNITVSFANGSGTALSWQTDHVRFYHSGSKVTIRSTSTNITKIVVNAKSGYASADLKVGSTSLESNDAKTVYTYTPASAINTVTITNDGSAQARLTSIVVTVGGSTPTALSAPTNLSSSNVTTTGATLSWNAVANASSYTVKIGAQEYTNVTTTSYNATGLTAGTQYTWSVKAVGDGENYSTSAYAANANFTTEAEQGGGDGTTVTWIASEQGYTNGTQYTSATVDENISLAFGDGGNDGKYYDTGTGIRLYANGKMTVTASNGATISRIVITYDSGNTGTFSASTGSYNLSSSTGTWTGPASSVVLTNTASSGHARIQKVVVTYTTDGGDPDPEKTPTSLTWSASTATATIGASNSYPTLTTDPGDLEGVTYDSSDKTVATIAADGTISLLTAGTTTITASYAGDETYAAATDATYILTVNAAPKEKHDVRFYVNGSQYGETQNIEEGETIVFPSENPVIDDVIFCGWMVGTITGTQDDAPEFVEEATMGEQNIEFHAVFATSDGNCVYKLVSSVTANNTYIFVNNNIIGSAYAFDASKLGDTASQTNPAVEVTITESSSEKIIENINSNLEFKYIEEGQFDILSSTTDPVEKMVINGNGFAKKQSNYKAYWNTDKGLYGTNSGGTKKYYAYYNETEKCFRHAEGPSSRVYAYEKTDCGYSDYCTTVSLDPKPTIVLSATELAEYAGNTNTSITASVSEGEYTGALTVESSAEAVATASISEGTITINALTAGSATITVTAPAVAGFRKNTATIAVTVSEKLAHGLSFSTDVLNLTVGDTEFSEPTLNNPNTLPVVYSLVYAKPENEGKVATINSETGKLTLADPSLSTETQGAVTVKASTVGDNSHAAGEVTYNLVVARKVTTTSWSNGGAAVTIDKDEIATLPTASNDGERNLFYESSNEDVAKFVDGALTFVAYGTTTITVKTTATAEYAATSASYELTFAPRYTVTFNVNGNETELREETTGAGVVAPTVEPIEGKVFRGWAEVTIDGTTDVAPAFVTTANLDGDKTLYAVFATESGSSTDVDITMGATSVTQDGVTIACAQAEGTNAPAWTSSECRLYAKNTITISASGDITAFSLTFHKQGSKEYISSITANIGTYTSGGESTSGEDNKIDTWCGSATSIILTAGNNGQRVLVGGTVTVGSFTYSDYCTTVKTTPTLSFAEATYNATVGETFEAPELNNPSEVEVTYSSSETSVADFVEGVLTIKAAGTTTITATFDGDATYEATSASYQLVVTAANPTFTPQTLTFKAQNDDGYWATFSSNEVTFWPDDYVVSAVYVQNDELSFWNGDTAFEEGIEDVDNENTIDGFYVPANTGVIINSFDADVTYYTVTNKTPQDLVSSYNMLVPCTSNGIFKEEADENYYYKLAYGDNTNKTKLGFWWGAEDGSGNFNVKAGGAVLVVPQSVGVRGFSFTPDGILTGVSSVSSDNDQNAIYNLQGMRMLKVQRGVNIVNGRKVIR